ncbi:hypothetical protein HMPREF1240_0890 [Streptococcus pyogenes GA03455]|nr:hypothetical protein HMPREF1240_0890 [Streptococcus pyogenes GA03455]
MTACSSKIFKKILYSENDIIRKTKKLGEQLTKDYQKKIRL